MCNARDVDDAGLITCTESRPEQLGQQEMADVAHSEMLLDPVCRESNWPDLHEACAVDEDIDARILSKDLGCTVADGLKRGEIDRVRAHGDAGIERTDRVGDGGELGGSASDEENGRRTAASES